MTALFIILFVLLVLAALVSGYYFVRNAWTLYKDRGMYLFIKEMGGTKLAVLVMVLLIGLPFLGFILFAWLAYVCGIRVF